MDMVVVNDGSDDGTGEVLDALAKVYPKLRIVHWKINRGKSRAIAEGAKHCTGEILVCVDSDCFVDPEGMYRIVQPFYDKTVGAVTAHLEVIIEDNWISKMEAVRYWFGCRMYKAAESLFGAVECCAGCFSAYRRDHFNRVVDDWLGQKVFGMVDPGDDRSLTNYFLRDYAVVYHAGAICRTFAPTTWGQFMRQQLRWKKSWLLQTLFSAMYIMHQKPPMACVAFYIDVVITLFTPAVMFYSVICVPFITPWGNLPFLVGLLVSYIAISAAYYCGTGKRFSLYGMAWGAVQLSVFSWQNYYAMFKLKENKWYTR